MRPLLRSLLRRRSAEPRVGATDSPIARRLGALLWAGFETSAVADLVALRDDPAASPDERSRAAYELGSWHLAGGRTEEALELVHAMRALCRGDLVDLDHVALEVDVLAELGHRDEAREALDAALTLRPRDAHLLLRRSNIGTDWLGPLAEVLESGGFEPVRRADPAQPLTLGNLAGDTRSRPVQADRPLVSVLVPVYNAESTIAIPLRSLVEQTWTELEILVVDDASTDATADVVTELAHLDPRIRLLRHAVNRGAYAARNTGLAEARGALVTVHDADDWSHPEKIATQVADLVAHPERWGNGVHLVRADDRLRFRPHGREPYKLVGKNTSSLMLRREALDAVGPWDEVRVAADFELLKRVEARFGAGAIKHLAPRIPLAIAGRSQGSLTGDSPAGIRSLWHAQGARRQYLEAFTNWHGSDHFAADLPLRPGSAPRPFACPSLISGLPSDGSDDFDVVVLADLAATPLFPSAAEIQALVKAGLRVGLAHHPVYELGPDRPVDPVLMEMVASRNPRLLSAGEHVACQLLIVHGDQHIDHPLAHAATIEQAVVATLHDPRDWVVVLSLLN